MSTINKKPFSTPKNINLSQGLLRFGAKQASAATPFDTSSYGLYVNSSGNLAYSSLGSVTVLDGGGGGTGTWETLFLADSTFTITPDVTFTIAGNRATATDVLTITNTAGGSGDCIQITNSGTGKDINGTSDTWSVTKAGLAVFVGITTTSDITSTGAAIDWDLADNSASALSFDAAGQAGILEIVTTNGSELVKFAKNIQVTDGIATLISSSNTVSNLLVTNNTVTTFGADADSSGVVVIRSTSLTTGALLQLQTTEGTLNGGFYVVCRDVTGTANVMTIGEDGRVVIAGSDSATVLTVTAGDVVVGGSIALTDNDNAATFTVTNNTATSASVVVVAGSGVFTGSTTSSFMTVTPSGLTTGTAIYVPLAGLTEGIGYHSVANALTTGKVVSVTSSATAITTTGRLLSVAHSGATGTSATLSEFSSAATDETTVLKVTASAALALGKALHISVAAMTTGTGLYIDATEGTLTTGKYIECYDGAANDFSVAKYGATVIAGNAATDVFTITAGHAVITSGNLTLTSGNAVLTAGNLTLTNGNIVVTAGNATLTNGNLLLTSGTLTMTSGSATLTAGNLVLTAGTIIETPQAIVNANTAISVTHGVTSIANNAPSTHTLADGVAGQRKTIICTVYTGDAVITPSNLANGSTITLNAVGDGCTLVFLGTEWFVETLYGTAALA